MVYSFESIYIFIRANDEINQVKKNPVNKRNLNDRNF